MSWFSQDWTSLAQSAKTALSTAQKTIDRALDIEENEEAAGNFMALLWNVWILFRNEMSASCVINLTCFQLWFGLCT